jgi:hypothetical protein
MLTIRVAAGKAPGPPNRKRLRSTVTYQISVVKARQIRWAVRTEMSPLQHPAM